MRHAHTSAEDWQAAADVVGEAATAESFEDFARAVSEGVRRLWQAELVCFNTFSAAGDVLSYRIEPDLSAVLGAYFEPFQKFWHEHPWSDWNGFMQRGLIGVRSEWTTWRKFRETALWNEVYVHLFAKSQLGFGGPLADGITWGVSANRLGSDFGPRDRELARFLQVRLVAIGARVVRHAKGANIASALQTYFARDDAAFVFLDTAGRVAQTSDAARRLLEVLPGGIAPDQLPAHAELRRMLRSPRSETGGPQVFALVPLSPMLAAVVLHLPAGGALLLLQSSSPAKVGVHLTRREAEILSWLGEGKTNAEIGTLLGVSPRTVEKHCGNLFAKLGVETRLAAALLARERTVEEYPG